MTDPQPLALALEEFAAEKLREQLANDTDAVRDLERDFRIFHRANPGVYTALVRLARQGKAAGHAHLGVKMLWEVLRWEVLVGDTKLGQGYKLNNNYTSRYARLIMENEEDLAEVFETRRLRS